MFGCSGSAPQECGHCESTAPPEVASGATACGLELVLHVLDFAGTPGTEQRSLWGTSETVRAHYRPVVCQIFCPAPTVFVLHLTQVCFRLRVIVGQYNYNFPHRSLPLFRQQRDQRVDLVTQCPHA